GASDGGSLGGATGSGGAPPSCSDSSPERQTDILNCGTCGNLCKPPHGAAQTCIAGKCGFECLLGTVDADKDPANGCECTPTVITGADGGVVPEVCDGIDNDCNGTVDDGFNLMTDLNNCGGCNRPCFFPFASASCVNGQCMMGACLPDFYDRDSTVPGCETSCQKTNGGVEI